MSSNSIFKMRRRLWGIGWGKMVGIDPEMDEAELAEFCSLVEPNRSADDCWLWLGRVNGYGYAAFARPKAYPNRRDRKKPIWRFIQSASRIAFILTWGSIPAGTYLRHTCDNKLCVNPDHLIPGTHADNMRDAVERGRMRNGHTVKTLGRSSKYGKLTEEEVCQRIAAAKAMLETRTP